MHYTWPTSFPAAKAIQLRAFLFALHAQSATVLHQTSPSQDLLCALKNLCPSLNHTNPLILPKSPRLQQQINVGNSGLLLRFLSAYASLQSKPFTIDGDASVRMRPMLPLLNALRTLGATIHYLDREGYAPFIIHGPIKGGRVVLSSIDSQHASALIYALAFANGSSVVTWGKLGEHPYIELTLQWLDFLKIPYARDNWATLSLNGAFQLDGFETTIPKDIGLMSFPMVLSLLHRKPIHWPYFPGSFIQPDSAFLDVLKRMGIPIENKKNHLSLPVVTHWDGIDVNINECIDCLPLLSLIATQARTPSRIYGAAVSQTKESPRLTTTAQELQKMGARIDVYSDGLNIYPSKLHPAQTSSHGDHRLAMMLWIANSWLEHKGTVDHLECIQKSYPTFVDDATMWESLCLSI